jgi:hypothetical protein
VWLAQGIYHDRQVSILVSVNGFSFSTHENYTAKKFCELMSTYVHVPILGEDAVSTFLGKLWEFNRYEHGVWRILQITQEQLLEEIGNLNDQLEEEISSSEQAIAYNVEVCNAHVEVLAVYARMCVSVRRRNEESGNVEDNSLEACMSLSHMASESHVASMLWHDTFVASSATIVAELRQSLDRERTCLYYTTTLIELWMGNYVRGWMGGKTPGLK